MAVDKNTRLKIIGRLALLGTTLIWGSSFVILKNVLDNVSTLYILAIRFSGAAILTALTGIKELRKMDMGYLKSGALMGVFLFVAYALQTFGLAHTTPGKNAFLTSTYAIIVPFLGWAIYKKKPDVFNISAGFMAIAGIGLVSLNSDLRMGLGETLTTFCGLFYAIHILVTSRMVQNRSVMLLNMVQFATVAVISWFFALATEPFPKDISVDSYLGIAYLCVMCTAVCYFLQTLGQKYTPPATVAIILTLESVFGTAISVIFYNEKLSLRLVIGFLLIFLAVLVSETKLSLIREKLAALKDYSLQ
ncbi:MAG: DMT family transporter [Oscillospiraceae bacterium]|jgi:drug/metabolite transporter (DMT)-like permease